MIKEIFLMALVVVFISCSEKEIHTKKPFFDSYNRQIGDSFFVNNLVQKIIFLDTSYEIDSIVFTRKSKSSLFLQSVNTYKRGKKIFENIEYYDNGNIKKYSFIDEDNSSYYYERLYHNTGALTKINGEIFFQGFIIDTASKNIDIKKGSTISYRIYYPNPPDCVSNIYIKNDDNSIYDVFQKSNFLNFLQIANQDNDNIGTYKTNIMLELEDRSMDTTIQYIKGVIYKVIP